MRVGQTAPGHEENHRGDVNERSSLETISAEIVRGSYIR